MRAPRLALLSIPVAALALTGAQLGASAAAAAPADSSTGVVTLTVPAVTTVGTASTITAEVPSNGSNHNGFLDVDINALANLPASDLTLTETTGSTTQTITLSNAAADDGDATDAYGTVAVNGGYLSATGGQTTTFSLTVKPAASSSDAGVRGQLEIYVEFESDDGTYDADNTAGLDAGQDFTQIPRATPEKVAENVAVFRPSTQSIYYANANVAGGRSPSVHVSSGLTGDKLLTGDVFGSGDSYVVDYRPATTTTTTGTFYLADGFATASDGSVRANHWEQIHWGLKGDIPLVGAFPTSPATGGSIDTVATYRPSNNTFYVYGAQGGLQWGVPGDIPLVGNWTGTQDSQGDAGADSVGVFRPSNHTFYLLNLNNTRITKVFGQKGDVPLVGDWNGNGTSVVGIRRGTTFYLANTNSNTDRSYQTPFIYGNSGDVPLAAYTYTPMDLTAVADAYSDNAVVAKTTAARHVDHAVRAYPRTLAALTVR